MMTAKTVEPEEQVEDAGALDRELLTSEPKPLELSDGTKVWVERLKTRQTFALLNILTTGASSALAQLSFNADTGAEEFAQQLAFAVIFSIPQAEDETIAFIKRMIRPDLIEATRLSEPEQEINEERIEHLDAFFDNPELEDLITVVEQVVKNEAPHILSLGKRLAQLLQSQGLSSQSPTKKLSR